MSALLLSLLLATQTIEIDSIRDRIAARIRASGAEAAVAEGRQADVHHADVGG